MAEDADVAAGPAEPDPIWRATVEMADHALDPDVPEDSSLDADDLPA